MENTLTNDQIKVSVDGEESITLDDLININNEEEEVISTEEIETLRSLTIGDHIFLGISQVKRTA